MSAMKIKRVFVTLAGVLFLFAMVPLAINAQVPEEINFQGYLTDSGGNPLNGDYSMQFSLYDVDTGGIALWSETQPVTVVDGIYNIALGSSSPLSSDLFGGPRYLGVQIGADSEMTPRQVVSSVAYSLYADTASMAYTLADGGIGAGNLFVAGNVGIGTTTPQGGLHVYGNGGDGTALFERSGKILALNPNYGDDNQFAHITTVLGSNMGLKLDANEQTGLTLTTSGNIGIGTSYPSEKLHVYNATSGYNDPIAIFESGTHSRIDIRGPGTDKSLGIQFSDPNDSWKGGFLLNETTNDLEFFTNSDGNNPRMVIEDQYGTLDLESGIRCWGLTTEGGRVYVEREVEHDNVAFGMYSIVTAHKAEGIRAWGHGTYGIGVAGGGDYYDFFAQGDGVNYGAWSSIRWKMNVVEIDSPLEKLAELRGVYFDWDEEHGGQKDVGCIAEEVGKVFPEIVAYEENGIDAHGMDYSKLTPFLIEVAKAQQQLIDQLEKRVEELENK